jgi:hypothetical protein
MRDRSFCEDFHTKGYCHRLDCNKDIHEATERENLAIQTIIFNRSVRKKDNKKREKKGHPKIYRNKQEREREKQQQGAQVHRENYCR